MQSSEKHEYIVYDFLIAAALLSTRHGSLLKCKNENWNYEQRQLVTTMQNKHQLKILSFVVCIYYHSDLVACGLGHIAAVYIGFKYIIGVLNKVALRNIHNIPAIDDHFVPHGSSEKAGWTVERAV